MEESGADGGMVDTGKGSQEVTGQWWTQAPGIRR